jgi:hypothetical protein
MAFTKITNAQLNQRGATTLPNQPTIEPTLLKQEFDAPAKEVVAPAFNNLIDELQATSAAADVGATAPAGRTGTSTQAVMNSISGDLATVETNMVAVLADEHTHANKALLDTYDQTNADIAQAITDDHTHSNKSTIDKWSEGGGEIYFDGVLVGKGTASNAVKNIKVGTSTITASGEDTIELKAGNNIILHPNTTTKVVEIEATGGGSGGGANWGSIGGTLSDQTDLQNELDGKADVSHNHGMSDLTDFSVSSPAEGDVLTYETGKWVNKERDKSIARYGGAKTFAQLDSSLLIADNVDKFYLCTDGGVVPSSGWILPAGSVIPADSHIAVIEDPNTAGSYLFDEFGGHVEVDTFTASITQSNGKVVFDNLNPDYGYAIHFDDTGLTGDITVPKWTNVNKTAGTTTGTIKLTYTISGGTNGTSKFMLRILK